MPLPWNDIDGETLRKIRCPECDEAGTVEQLPGGSSVREGQVDGEPQALGCTSCDFQGDESTPAILDQARKIKLAAVVSPIT